MKSEQTRGEKKKEHSRQRTWNGRRSIVGAECRPMRPQREGMHLWEVDGYRGRQGPASSQSPHYGEKKEDNKG
jgi:hypothetical protein